MRHIIAVLLENEAGALSRVVDAGLPVLNQAVLLRGVNDCLETLEEIGIRAREQWASLGGEDLCLIPCVNADPSWVAGLAKIVRETAGAPITANERPS